ncbi:DUF1963 domain-containing protein [Massilia violaceinigra]|uniref:DUF1963 domain-containing protein n=1 Tax=Massilia violaceinigra TaxID=2045208 RepID=A0ABY4A3G6_9BURK|nr:DUF1963 domain-containing protein [Massilia violaceinigra]UOD28584.1 DUF1963 domain-containing protein [Massilia violaceinigra]
MPLSDLNDSHAMPRRAGLLLVAALLLTACSPEKPAPARGAPAQQKLPPVVYGQLPPELARYAEAIERSRLPYIHVGLHKPDKLAPWNSSLGGAAYLPKGQPYPAGPDGVPLTLLAQFNFAEMPALEGYPTRGMLQFYISGSESKEHFYGVSGESTKPYNAEREFLSLTRQRWYRVLYHPTVVQDRKKLQATKVIASDNLPMAGTSALTFEIRTEPVSVQDYRFERILGQPPWELFKQFGARQDAVSENYETFSQKYTIAKLGGYSNPTQTDVRTAQPGGDWLVLFELQGGGVKGGFYSEWGDTGMAVFYIRRTDLARRDFSQVVYSWDNL